MHEYAVTKSLIKIVLNEAQNAGAGKVTSVKLVIGDLSTIIDESVQMYYDIMSEDTIAKGSKLIFRRVPAEFQCKACGHKYNKPKQGFDCPLCGSFGTPTGVGKEFYIESIEVE